MDQAQHKKEASKKKLLKINKNKNKKCIGGQKRHFTLTWAPLKMRKFRDNKISLHFHITFVFSCGGSYCENIIIEKS